MVSLRTAAKIHTAVVGLAVAALVYFTVPQFVPILSPLGPELPPSTRVLLAAYPWAFVAPLAGVTLVHFVPSSSQRLWIVLVVTYVIAAFIVVFLFWALYAPMYDLAAAK